MEKTGVKAPGRPKGSGGVKHFMTIAKDMNKNALQAIVDRLKSEPDLQSPLEFLFNVVNGYDRHGNPIDASMKERIGAAVAVAPYLHMKLPTALEVSGPDGGPVEVVDVTKARIENILFGDVIEAETVEHAEEKS